MSQLRKGIFKLAILPNYVFEGYTDGSIDEYTGAAMPYFTQKQAVIVLKAMREVGKPFLWILPGLNFIKWGEDGGDVEFLQGHLFPPNGMTLYGLGRGNWLWGEIYIDHPVPEIGQICHVVSLDDIEHEDEENGGLRTDLLGKEVLCKSYYRERGIGLTEGDPIIECTVIETGEDVGFYRENLRIGNAI